MSLLTEEDELETELLLIPEGAFRLCVLFNEEIPKLFRLALVVWVFWVGLLVLEEGFVFMLVVLDVEGGFPPLNSSCESCGVRVWDFVELDEGACCVLVWELADLTIAGIFWVIEGGEAIWLFWIDEEPVWNVGFSEEINEGVGAFLLLAVGAAKLEGKDAVVETLWLENWGDCAPNSVKSGFKFEALFWGDELTTLGTKAWGKVLELELGGVEVKASLVGTCAFVFI